MQFEFTLPIAYAELEKELRGFARMLAVEGYSRIDNLVISFDGRRDGDPPLESWDRAGINGVTIEGRLGSIRWPRPK